MSTTYIPHKDKRYKIGVNLLSIIATLIIASPALSKTIEYNLPISSCKTPSSDRAQGSYPLDCTKVNNIGYAIKGYKDYNDLKINRDSITVSSTPSGRTVNGNAMKKVFINQVPHVHEHQLHTQGDKVIYNYTFKAHTVAAGSIIQQMWQRRSINRSPAFALFHYSNEQFEYINGNFSDNIENNDSFITVKVNTEIEHPVHPDKNVGRPDFRRKTPFYGKFGVSKGHWYNIRVTYLPDLTNGYIKYEIKKSSDNRWFTIVEFKGEQTIHPMSDAAIADKKPNTILPGFGIYHSQHAKSAYKMEFRDIKIKFDSNGKSFGLIKDQGSNTSGNSSNSNPDTNKNIACNTFSSDKRMRCSIKVSSKNTCSNFSKALKIALENKGYKRVDSPTYYDDKVKQCFRKASRTSNSDNSGSSHNSTNKNITCGTFSSGNRMRCSISESNKNQCSNYANTLKDKLKNNNYGKVDGAMYYDDRTKECFRKGSKSSSSGSSNNSTSKNISCHTFDSGKRMRCSLKESNKSKCSSHADALKNKLKDKKYGRTDAATNYDDRSKECFKKGSRS